MEIKDGESREMSEPDMAKLLNTIRIMNAEQQVPSVTEDEIANLTKGLINIQSRLAELQSKLRRDILNSNVNILCNITGSISSMHSDVADFEAKRVSVLMAVLDKYKAIIESEIVG